MSAYNTTLRQFRNEKNLTLKKASKEIGISRLRLFLFENGYFKPRGKTLDKIEKYYDKKIDLTDENSYPVPFNKKQTNLGNKKSLFTKRIVFASLTILMLITSIVGGHIFSSSLSNSESSYGETYISLKKAVQEKGKTGHDLVTALEYYQVNNNHDGKEVMITFYKTDNLLYINECTYTLSIDDYENVEVLRYSFSFGGGLNVNSYLCNFTYGSVSNYSYYSCEFYFNKNGIETINNFKTVINGYKKMDEEKILNIINTIVPDVNNALSSLIEDTLGEAKDFQDDFLSAREKGRNAIFASQLSGLSLLIGGTLLFFVSLFILTRLLVKNIKPGLVDIEVEEDKKIEPLPKDINMGIGIPDFLLLIISRILVFSSIALLLVSFVGKLGKELGAFSFIDLFYNDTFLNILHILLLSGVFMEHIIVLGKHKTPTIIFGRIIYNFFLFLLLATLETEILIVINDWGFDIASVAFKVIPGNLFLVIGLEYTIYLLLFFEPTFLNKREKWMKYLWHSLSFIPLGLLIVSYVIGNTYILTYGVQADVFIKFWFPSGFLFLSIVTTVYIYIIFGTNLFYERKYGKKKAQLFFYGDRFTLIENLLSVLLIVIVGLIDLSLANNQYAYYIGLGNNSWMFILIPFILLCKYSPNRKQNVLLSDELIELSRDI